MAELRTQPEQHSVIGTGELGCAGQHAGSCEGRQREEPLGQNVCIRAGSKPLNSQMSRTYPCSDERLHAMSVKQRQERPEARKRSYRWKHGLRCVLSSVASFYGVGSNVHHNGINFNVKALSADQDIPAAHLRHTCCCSKLLPLKGPEINTLFVEGSSAPLALGS